MVSIEDEHAAGCRGVQIHWFWMPRMAVKSFMQVQARHLKLKVHVSIDYFDYLSRLWV